MLPDIKSSPTMPSKGKTKETQQWQVNWWDAQGLAERDSRPLEWSKSSVLFTAHPSQPLVCARHFSSSRNFVLQSPGVIENSPNLYGPPTLISVDPDDNWLFGFFPGQDTPGMGCLWKKGLRIDDWTVKECWPFPQGAGVVAAAWLGIARQWIPSGTNERPKRLPVRGPATPMSSPTLLLVTQNHYVQIRCLRQFATSFGFLSCSLKRADNTEETRQEEAKPTSARICSKAAIGLHYNENSILIATRSCILPSTSSDLSQYDDIPTVIQPQLSEVGVWGEESVVEIAEVHFGCNVNYSSQVSMQISLTVEPLPALTQLSGSITKLEFISTPRSNLTTAPVETHFYLASSFLDFADYTSTPKSSLVVHSILRQANPRPHWVWRQTGSKIFSPQLLAFTTAPRPGAGPVRDTLLVGVVNSSGSLPPPKSGLKKLNLGEIKSLLLPDLSDDANSNSVELVTAVEATGINIPVQAAMSPNGVLLATLTPSLSGNKTAIHQLPSSKRPAQSPSKNTSYLPPAIMSHAGTSDLVHQFNQSSTTIDEVCEALYQTLKGLQGSRKKLSHTDFMKFMGASNSIYRGRAESSKKLDEKELLTGRWKVAHDVCSLGSCVTAFEDLTEGGKYDLDAVWQLIALSTWLVNFAQKLVKECVLFTQPNGTDGPAEPPLIQSSISPTLLHLVHPQVLQLFLVALNHLQQFRNFIGSLSSRAGNPQIARDVLLDLVDGSSIDFAALIDILTSGLKDGESLNQENCMKALASCQPKPEMWPLIVQIMKKVTDAAILNKCTLFIQASDLADENPGTSLAAKSTRGRDVVLKRVISGPNPPAVCLVCGGLSEVQADWGKNIQQSPRWNVWERNSMVQCVCGGDWASARGPVA